MSNGIATYAILPPMCCRPLLYFESVDERVIPVAHVASEELAGPSAVLVSSPCTWNGCSALTYQTDFFSVTVLLGRGGKIASLKDGFGNEWLAQPELPLGSFPPSSFVDGDMCGWDECAPTVAACEVDELLLPDHGELWSQAWIEGRDGWHTAQGKSWRYRLSRRFAIQGSKLVIEYELLSDGDKFPFLWAAHPQFLVDEETVIIFDKDVKKLVDVMTPSLPMVDVAAASRVGNFASDTCAKFYVDPTKSTFQVGMRRGDGSQIDIAWSEHLPYLGIWIDRSVYARQDVVSIAPSGDYYDSCELAFRSGRVPEIAPNSKLTWQLAISFSPSDSSNPPHPGLAESPLENC